MAKFKKKPVVIEAHRVGDDGWPDSIWQGVNENKIILHLDRTGHPKKTTGYVEIHTLEGVMRGEVGDWIVQGVSGEFYPCKPDIFVQTYEIVTEKGKARPMSRPRDAFAPKVTAMKIDESHPAVAAGASVFGSDQLLIDRRNGDHVTVTLATLNAALPHVIEELAREVEVEAVATKNGNARWYEQRWAADWLRSKIKDNPDD